MADPGPLAASAPLRILADDLTGAADSAIPFTRPGTDVTLQLTPSFRGSGGAVLVTDTNTRDADAATARAAVAWAAGRIPPGAHVLKKIDSLLRGQIAAELGALRQAFPDRLVIVAPAVPAHARPTVAAAVRPTPGSPPLAVPAALGAVPPALIGLDIVRPMRWWAPESAGGGAGDVRAGGGNCHGQRGEGGAAAGARAEGGRLAGALAAAGRAGAVAVCDAASEADLDAIVAAGLSQPSPVLWVGASGLAAALARALHPARRQAAAPSAPAASASPLVIVGSHSAMAADEVAALAAGGAAWTRLDAGALLALAPGQRDRLGAELARDHRLRVVSLTGPVDPERRSAVAVALGALSAQAIASADTAVLIGGATARSVLTQAGVTALRLLAEPAPGAVLSEAVFGNSSRTRPLRVITRSGSFTGPATLERILAGVSGQPGCVEAGPLCR